MRDFRLPPSLREDDLVAETPAERAAVAEVAARASERLAKLTTDPALAPWLDAAPIAWAADLVANARPLLSLRGVGLALEVIADRLQAVGGAWEGPYGELLTLALLATAPAASPPVRIPRALWPSIEAGLEVVLERAPHAAAAGWKDEFFEKDLAVPLFRFLPYGGGATLVERKVPAMVARGASRRDRLSVLRSLRAAYFRRGLYVTRHQWHAFREGIRTPHEARDAGTFALLHANPSIAGLFISGWTCDPALAAINPHLYEWFHESYARMGGTFFRMPIDDLSRARALESSATRQALYEAGRYDPAIYGVFVRRRDVLGRSQVTARE